MVDDQAANQTAKSLKKGKKKKKKTHCFWNSRVTVLVVLVLLLYHPVLSLCVSLAALEFSCGRQWAGGVLASLWGRGLAGRQSGGPAMQEPGGAAIWQACRVRAWQSCEVGAQQSRDPVDFRSCGLVGLHGGRRDLAGPRRSGAQQG
jgi:hypothetical protein